MKKDLGDAVDLEIHTNDASEAKDFEIRSALSVFVNGERVPLKVALKNERMHAYLKERF